METIFQDLVDDFGNKTDLVDDLVKEVKTLSHENVSLKTENAGLKNQLKTAENVFQTVVTEHSRRVTSMGNTMEIFFQTLADEFEDKF
jgi:cell division protein FtsB